MIWSYLFKVTLLELGVETSSLILDWGGIIDGVGVKHVDLPAMRHLEALQAGVNGSLYLGRLKGAVTDDARDHDLGIDLEAILGSASVAEELFGNTDGSGWIESSSVESGDRAGLEGF